MNIFDLYLDKIKKILSDLSKKQNVTCLITGSLYLMGEILNLN